MTSLYIHIPFCVKKCNYCDFLSFPNTEYIDAYKKALIKEINAFDFEPQESNAGASGASRFLPLAKNSDCEKIKSIFIGGGTPSLLEGSIIGEIMDALCKFNIMENAEITIEANPDTISEEKLKIYRQKGINRVSIGLQAWQNNLLSNLGRIHTLEKFLSAYEMADKYFENINVDLMFSLPNQTMDMWLETLENVTALNPKHISAYSLIVEEGTPFYNMPLNLPDEETDRLMYHNAIDFLSEKGYKQYEISNFAKEGFHSVHNCVYWQRGEYKGFGLGAASLLSDIRYKNTEDIKEYISGITIAEKEVLGTDDIMAEYMFLGLRMNEGVSISDFKAKFKYNPLKKYSAVLNKYSEFFIIDNDRLRLTTRGFDISNSIFSEML